MAQTLTFLYSFLNSGSKRNTSKEDKMLHFCHFSFVFVFTFKFQIAQVVEYNSGVLDGVKRFDIVDMEALYDEQSLKTRPKLEHLNQYYDLISAVVEQWWAIVCVSIPGQHPMREQEGSHGSIASHTFHRSDLQPRAGLNSGSVIHPTSQQCQMSIRWRLNFYFGTQSPFRSSRYPVHVCQDRHTYLLALRQVEDAQEERERVLRCGALR
eukprot:6442321-Amphidinium_carterae.4